MQPLKPNTTEKGCQTSSHNSHSRNSELFQKQLEASTFKLETSCKQMEKLCNQLKNEKEQIEHLLRTEKETVAFLRKQIQDLQMEKVKEGYLLAKKIGHSQIYANTKSLMFASKKYIIIFMQQGF